MNFSDQNSSVAYRRCCCHFKFLTFFYLLLQKHMTNFNQTFHKASLKTLGNSKFIERKDHTAFQEEIIQNSENTFKTLQIFSRTTGRISTKTGTKYLCVKRFCFCWKDGSRIFAREVNKEINTLTNSKNLPEQLVQFKQKAAQAFSGKGD